jgi:hypothetical protein
MDRVIFSRNIVKEVTAASMITNLFLEKLSFPSWKNKQKCGHMYVGNR